MAEPSALESDLAEVVRASMLKPRQQSFVLTWRRGAEPSGDPTHQVDDLRLTGEAEMTEQTLMIGAYPDHLVFHRPRHLEDVAIDRLKNTGNDRVRVDSDQITSELSLLP